MATLHAKCTILTNSRFSKILEPGIDNYIDIKGDRLALRKDGTIVDFSGDVIQTVDTARYGKIKAISSGTGFGLALTESRIALLITFYTNGVTDVHLLWQNVDGIFAEKTQFCLFSEKDENALYKGTNRIKCREPYHWDGEEENMCYLWSQLTNIAIPVNCKLLRVDLGAANGCALVQVDKTVFGQKKIVNRLVTWGDNTFGQCGASPSAKILESSPFAVAERYPELPQIEQTGWTSNALYLLTKTKVLYQVGGSSRDHKPHVIDLHVHDIENLYTSPSVDSVMLSREFHGAVGFGSSPYGNIGVQRVATLESFFGIVHILPKEKVLHLAMNKFFTFVMTQHAIPDMALLQTKLFEILQKRIWNDCIIICVETDERKMSERRNKNRKENKNDFEKYYNEKHIKRH
jgi:hypothetical protein